MMQRKVLALPAALVLLATLAACGEKPQTGQAIRHDAPLHAGTGSSFSQPGWQAGDRTSWESHLKARQQYGQNEYTRTTAK